MLKPHLGRNQLDGIIRGTTVYHSRLVTPAKSVIVSENLTCADCSQSGARGELLHNQLVALCHLGRILPRHLTSHGHQEPPACRPAVPPCGRWTLIARAALSTNVSPGNDGLPRRIDSSGRRLAGDSESAYSIKPNFTETSILDGLTAVKC